MGGIDMAWVAVHKNGGESIFAFKPVRKFDCWWNKQTTENDWYDTEISLPKGAIKKLIGRDLTWEDEPVELKDE